MFGLVMSESLFTTIPDASCMYPDPSLSSCGSRSKFASVITARVSLCCTMRPAPKTAFGVVVFKAASSSANSGYFPSNPGSKCTTPPRYTQSRNACRRSASQRGTWSSTAPYSPSVPTTDGGKRFSKNGRNRDCWPRGESGESKITVTGPLDFILSSLRSGIESPFPALSRHDSSQR